MTDVGEYAPDFTLPRDNGEELTLSSLRPKLVVLFFFPKADTGGCTKEAVAFTEMREQFAAAGAEVIGISKDTSVRLSRFREKHDLGVTLLSDSAHDVCERYGVWVEKRMYGKTYMGIERSTFLIGGEGLVYKAWRKVRVAGHVEAVLETVKTTKA